ncbi:hypothetical protein GEMRC1_008784 [Eukaryota sp. GEM-RC1]
MKPNLNKPLRAVNALLPIIVTVLSVISIMIYSGYESISDQKDELSILIEIADSGDVSAEVDRLQLLLDSLDYSISSIFGNAQVFDALLNGAIVGVILSIILNVSQKIATLGQSMNAFMAGFKSLCPSIVIILLAWSLGGAARVLGTASWLVSMIPEGFPSLLLVVAVFITSAIVAVSTGTAWGTLSLLIPLVLPLAVASSPGDERVLKAMIASVLSGAVFGNHVSILGDTTIIASLAARCDLLLHIKTQTPYALLVGGVVILFGYTPTMMGLNPWLSIGICGIVLLGILMTIGKVVPVFVLKDVEEDSMVEELVPVVEYSEGERE